MLNQSKTYTAQQMIAIGELLIKEATELKNGQPGVRNASRVGPRKGLSPEQRQTIISRRIKTAISK